MKHSFPLTKFGTLDFCAYFMLDTEKQAQARRSLRTGETPEFNKAWKDFQKALIKQPAELRNAYTMEYMRVRDERFAKLREMDAEIARSEKEFVDSFVSTLGPSLGKLVKDGDALARGVAREFLCEQREQQKQYSVSDSSPAPQGGDPILFQKNTRASNGAGQADHTTQQRKRKMCAIL